MERNYGVMVFINERETPSWYKDPIERKLSFMETVLAQGKPF